MILPRSALIVLCAALAAPALAQQGGGTPGGDGGSGGPAQVGVAELRREDVTVTVTLPGRAVAVAQTAIRPQVGGEIVEIAYEPGEQVDTGTVLFRLDTETLAAELTAAQVGVTGAEVAVTGAQATVDRYDRLQGSGVSRAELETAQVSLASAQAQLAAAQAARDLAQLALNRAQIRSPIDGVVDIAAVSVGDLVTASQTQALTTVTQLDPVYVDVSESRARILRNRERATQGNLQPSDGPDARLILETGQDYPLGGRMVSPGIAVSATTGTVPFRLEFPNPDRLILPGQFLRVEVTVGSVNAVLVPQRATSRAASGALTAFVVRDGRADQVTLTETGTHENAWIVTEGVEAGDALVLDGLTNLRDGAEVTPVPVEIDAQGVVREIGAAAAGADTPPAQAGAASAPAGVAPPPAEVSAAAAPARPAGAGPTAAN
ncbi:efflux RND transporter periplasmic adaptor subunit [Paracoccus luteus]|uniref:efflux RND transporter periplasmic adaptor subunit n=1 Tax=Paracoccus luteus TaxID=2508543 RepID=UPI00106FFB65|nr:efflux RND transporter periplasmic adaptor subunit [Paracoccus luteus]